MLETAMALVLERGTHGLTLTAVGEEAGYSRGLANFRYGSKEGLFNAMLSQYNKRWKQEASAFIGDRRGLDAFRSALDAVAHFLEEESRFMRAMHILYYETFSSCDIIRTRLAEQHSIYRDDIAKMIREGIADGSIRPNISPGQVAIQYCSFVFGLVYQWLISPEIDFRRAIHEYSDGVCELLKIEPVERSNAASRPKAKRKA
ncbi:TetR/AcrR family transcriptional regulator [Sphingomonas bisphenolicum]